MNRASAGSAPGSPVHVSVVLPCLNEQDSVGLCVEQALDAMHHAGLSGEVVVADNGSTDDSVAVALAAGARVVHERRKGYGAALQAGIRAAAGEVVVMADADHTYDLDRIADLVRPVLAGEADLMMGARLASASGKTMPLLHRFVGTPVLTFLVARATGGLRISDSQSGFRAFRRDAFAGLGARGSGMEFASEMLIKAARAGWRVSEIPTTYHERIGESKLNTFVDGWRHLRLITLLAPDLVLVWPGAAMLAFGMALSIWSLASPGGVALGSLRWQPVFFSTIAMVFGAQSLLAGLVMAFRSSVAGDEARRRFGFVGHPRFPIRSIVAGVGAAAAGLAIDVGLFVTWISGGSDPRALALASLAQSLLIMGATLAVFGMMARLLLDRRRNETGMRVLGLADLTVVPTPSPERAEVSA